MRTRSGNELDPLNPLPPSNVQPPPPRPRRTGTGPPPPPPPLPAGVRAQQQHQQQQQQQPQQQQVRAATDPVRNEGQQPQQRQGQGQPGAPPQAAGADGEQFTREWVLRLSIRAQDGKLITKVGVQVTPDMNAAGLAACLGQAFESVDHHHGSSSLQRLAHVPHPIAGLFIEKSGLFVSLEHLLAEPSLRNKTFGLTYCPPPPQPPPPKPWYRETRVWIALSGPVVVGILYKFGSEVAMVMGWIFQSLHDLMVQLPLRETYRNGPWFLGWEGAALPAICARITYFGDVDFWRRNYQECADIYKVKEQAFLRIAFPTIYVIIILLLMFVLNLFLRHWQHVARYRHEKAVSSAPPPEMAETYRAFQTLLRQVRKGLEPEQPPPGQQQQPHHRGRELDHVGSKTNT